MPPLISAETLPFGPAAHQVRTGRGPASRIGSAARPSATEAALSLRVRRFVFGESALLGGCQNAFDLRLQGGADLLHLGLTLRPAQTLHLRGGARSQTKNFAHLRLGQFHLFQRAEGNRPTLIDHRERGNAFCTSAA